MKNTVLLILLTFLSYNQSTGYSDSRISSFDKFENTLSLEKVEGIQDTYKFSFNCWRISYDFLVKP